MRLIEMTATVAMVLAAGLALSGCPASMSGGAYTRDQARQAQEVQLGYVENVRQVLIEGTRSGVGAVSGAALGGLAGSTIGQGRGQVAGAIGGAVLGGVAGSAIEENVTRQPGLEITIRLDNGRMIAVTQAADEPFYPGDRVRLMTGYDGTARVAHYY
ncbi:MAG: glycine zipper 2TM domain-containing protein [Candidatus Competibacter sp.]|nr:glycine zipper 2TM domain-containing protein [Candidatus Competibacter sp.]MDS4071115.1 glycine zipper 2TM domain-containing protein [Candidatus Competibacter sp.]